MLLRDVLDLSDIDVRVSIPTMGHDPPIVPGTFVELVHSLDVLLSSDIGDDPSAASITMAEAGVGSIVGHTWHVDPLELRRAQIDPVLRDTRVHPHPVLRGVYRHMWYNVAFRAGLFWARYDWVKLLEAR